MARRFEFYRIKRREDLGNPETWNKRFQDLDLRLDARERDGEKIDSAIVRIETTALSRLNDTFTPLIEEASERLRNASSAFTARSETGLTIGVGEKLLFVVEEDRDGFIVSDYVSIRPPGDLANAMFGAVQTYNRDTGELVVDIESVLGEGSFGSWEIKLSQQPNLLHEIRTDNPHSVTAAQVGLGSVNNTADVDKPVSTAQATADTAARDAAISTIRDGAPAALNTLDKLAAAIADDAAFAATISAALAAKAPINNAALTGNPTAPTQTAGNNSTRLATTAFVLAEIAAATAAPVPVGTVVAYAGTAAPTNWIFCFGQAISRAGFPLLFAVLGTAYGAGDGSTTFNLPDFRGRVIAGKGNMGGVSANRLTGQAGGLNGDNLGATGGAETHALTEAQLAAHVHTVDMGAEQNTGSAGSHTHGLSATFTYRNRAKSGDGGEVADLTSTGDVKGVSVSVASTTYTGTGANGSQHFHSFDIPAFNSGSKGSGQAHNNVQPTIIQNLMIFAGQ